MPRQRDSRGRFVRGCSHSRDAKTKKCLSHKTYASRMQRLSKSSLSKRRMTAKRTIGSAVKRTRDQYKHTSPYTDFEDYVPFSPPYKPFTG